MTKTAQTSPDYSYELAGLAEHPGFVAGVDEAGRGPWAGPVVAAAVILDADNIPAGLNDSKKLNEAKREKLFDPIMASSYVGIAIAGPQIIDRDNILAATMGAMRTAVERLPRCPSLVLIDGNRCPPLDMPATAVIKGDQLSLSIAAASIIAKVTRDRLMCELALEFPQYGFERHKGYGTKAHQQALTEFGVTKHHRCSFKPIRKLIEQAKKQSD